MKKIGIIVLVVVIFNFIFPTLIYALDSDDSKMDEMQIDPSAYEEGSESGTFPVHGESGTIDEPISASDNVLTSVTSIFMRLINPIPGIAHIILSLLVSEDMNSPASFTIQGLIFDEFPLTNIDIFDGVQNRQTISEWLTGNLVELLGFEEDAEGNKISASREVLKYQVRVWYYIVRNIAIVISLCILIYMGIRMALSTIAEEKAKYKKMLIDWVVAFVMIWIMQYIFIILIEVQKMLMGLLSGILDNMVTGNASLEESILATSLTGSGGFKLVRTSIIFWVVVFYQIKFFMLYLKRLLAVSFLTVISPLITITYPIDKIKDRKSQVFNAFFKEYATNIFIQPIHAVLFILFIVTAFHIADKSPLLVVVFFVALSRGERIIRNIFRVNDLSSIQSLSKTFNVGSMSKGIGKLGSLKGK